MNKRTILLLAYLPYYLNDVFNITVTDYTAWTLIDYAVRFIVLGFLAFMLYRKRLSRGDLGLTWPGLEQTALWTGVTLGAAMGFLAITELFLGPHFPKGSFGNAPLDDTIALYYVDITFGLLLVAISEEVVCRGLTLTVLKERFSSPALYVVSAALFSLMHWSLSTHTLFDAFFYGLIFVPATLATGSILPATITHFMVNFVLYTW